MVRKIENIDTLFSFIVILENTKNIINYNHYLNFLKINLRIRYLFLKINLLYSTWLGNSSGIRLGQVLTSIINKEVRKTRMRAEAINNVTLFYVWTLITDESQKQ